MPASPLGNDAPQLPAAPGFDFRNYVPGVVAPFANQAANAAFAQAADRRGYLQAPLYPGVNAYHQLEALDRLRQMEEAVRQAGAIDRMQAAQAVAGIQAMIDRSGHVKMQQAWQLARAVDGGMHAFTLMFPEFTDQALGPTGSARVMAMGLAQGLPHRINPVTGRPYNARDAGAFTTALFPELYRPGSDMSGFRAGQAGQIFDEMSRRGLLASMPAPAAAGVQDWGARAGGGAAQVGPMLGRTDVNTAAGKVREMAQALPSVNDLMGANGSPNAPIPALFEQLDKLSHGQSHALRGGELAAVVRRAQAMTTEVAGGLKRYGQISGVAGGVTAALGVDPAFAMQIAEGSTAFGEAFGRRAGFQGFGGLSKDAATLLDAQLRGSAVASPMANALGAFMAMDAAGLVRGGTEAANVVAAVRGRDSKTLAGLANLSASEMMGIATRSGIGAGAVDSFFRGGAGVQQQIFANNIGDLVRGVQGAGGANVFVQNALEGGLVGTVRDPGTVRKAAAAIAQELAKIRQTDPELLSDPKRIGDRNRRLEAAVAAATGLAGPRLKEAVAAAYQALEASIAASPQFGKFGNVAGLFAMMGGDVHGEANAIRNRAQARAGAAEIFKGLAGSGGPVGMAFGAIVAGLRGAGADTNLGDLGMRGLGGVDLRQYEAALGAVPGGAVLGAGLAGVQQARQRAGPGGAAGTPVPVVVVNDVRVAPGGPPNLAGAVPAGGR